MNWGILREARDLDLLLGTVLARTAFDGGCGMTASAERKSAAAPLFEFQIASAGACFVAARMNGLGPRPLPAAIVAILRPDATERSAASKTSLLSRANSSRCFMRSQLFF